MLIFSNICYKLPVYLRFFQILHIGKFLYGMDLSSPKDSKTMSHVGGCGYANCVECFREDLKFKLEV